MNLKKRTIFIHGFLGTSAMWEGLLGEGHLTLGLPGHDTGRCPENAISEDLGSFEDAVGWALDRLPPEPVCLVGYSMGARLALALALAPGFRVGELILIGANPGLVDPRERMERLRWEASLVAKLNSGSIEAFVDKWEGLPLFASQRGLPQGTLERQRRMRLSNEPAQLARCLKVLGLGAMPNMWERLPDLISPVTYVTGETDTKFSTIGAKAQGSSMNAQHVVVSGCGHNCVLEKPEEVARLWGTKNSSGA